MIKYIIRRLLVLPIVIFFVTIVLFLMYLRLPVEQRALIYIPSHNPHITEEEFERLMQATIERHGLDDPLPVQYVKWLGDLTADEWWFSPTWRETVGLVISANLESRAKRPDARSSSRQRSGRRPPRREKPAKN